MNRYIIKYNAVFYKLIFKTKFLLKISEGKNVRICKVF